MGQKRDMVAGRNPVLEALKGPRRVHRIYYAGGTDLKGVAAEILGFAEREDISTDEVERSRLEELSGIGGHQGFAAQTESSGINPRSSISSKNRMVYAISIGRNLFGAAFRSLRSELPIAVATSLGLTRKTRTLCFLNSACQHCVIPRKANFDAA